MRPPSSSLTSPPSARARALAPQTFEVDLGNTARLLESEVGKRSLAEGYVWTGESGIFNADDVSQVQDAGCKAILVGESLVREDDPATAVKTLLGLE